MKGNKYALKHGMSNTPTYNSWRAMLKRVSGANDKRHRAFYKEKGNARSTQTRCYV